MKKILKFSGITLLLTLTLTTITQIIPNQTNQTQEQKNGLYVLDDNSQTKIDVGGEHSSVLTEDGRLFMWGRNEHGQLGNENNNDYENTLIEITNKFVDDDGKIDLIGSQISMGRDHSLLLTADGRMFSWGNNEYGQLGDGTRINKNKPVEITDEFIGVDLTNSSIEANSEFSSLLTEDGRLFMWGNNWDGQIGTGEGGSGEFEKIPREITDKFSSTDLTDAKISLGREHVSLLTENGKLFMWGSNEYGQLGDGTTTNRTSPVEITDRFHGIDLIGSKVLLGTYHSILLNSDNNRLIYMWGANNGGQILGSDNSNQLIPILKNDHFVSYGGLKDFWTGGGHSFARTGNGKLVAWGSNYRGQLGNGEDDNVKRDPVDISDQFKDLNGNQVSLENAQISLSISSSALLTEDGKLFIWGDNIYGQLGNGNGDISMQNTPKTDPFGSIEDIELNWDEDELTTLNARIKFKSEGGIGGVFDYRLIEDGESSGWEIGVGFDDGWNTLEFKNLEPGVVYQLEVGVTRWFHYQKSEEQQISEYGKINELEVSLDFLTLTFNFEYEPNALSSYKVDYRLIEDEEPQNWAKQEVEEGLNEFEISNLKNDTKYKIEIKIPEDDVSKLSEEVTTIEEKPYGLVEDYKVDVERGTATLVFEYVANSLSSHKVEYRLIKNGNELNWLETEVIEGYNYIEIRFLENNAEYQIEIKIPEEEDSQLSEKFLIDDEGAATNFNKFLILMSNILIVLFIFTKTKRLRRNI